MQSRLTRLLAALTTTLTIGVVAPLGASADTPRGSKPLSGAACDAFDDYFQINFAVAFLTGFAEAFEDAGTSGVSRAGGDDGATGGVSATGGDDGVGATGGDDGGATTGDDSTTPPDVDQLRNFVFLVLSPKLEQSTSVLAKRAPRSIRKLFAQQRDVYREGVELLRDDVGLTDEQIELIRDADFGEETPDELAGDLDVSRADLEAAAEEFGRSADVLTAEDATEAQSRAFERVAIGCGSVPDSNVDCDELVGVDLQERLLGGSATVENDDGTCTYTGEEGADGDEPELGVDVYRSTDAYERLVGQNEGAEEVDSDNAIGEGYTTFSNFKTCGRTLFSKEAGVTVVIALCPPDDGEVSDADLNEVRDSVNAVVES